MRAGHTQRLAAASDIPLGSETSAAVRPVNPLSRLVLRSYGDRMNANPSPGAAPGDPDEIETGPARTRLYFILGAVLAVIGLVGVGIYTFTPRNTPAEGDAQADAAWQTVVIIGSAAALGVGVLLLLLGMVASMRAKRE